jgi:hypothetical protein
VTLVFLGVVLQLCETVLADRVGVRDYRTYGGNELGGNVGAEFLLRLRLFLGGLVRVLGWQGGQQGDREQQQHPESVHCSFSYAVAPCGSSRL